VLDFYGVGIKAAEIRGLVDRMATLARLVEELRDPVNQFELPQVRQRQALHLAADWGHGLMFQGTLGAFESQLAVELKAKAMTEVPCQRNAIAAADAPVCVGHARGALAGGAPAAAQVEPRDRVDAARRRDAAAGRLPVRLRQLGHVR
jgi:hypothetical protein